MRELSYTVDHVLAAHLVQTGIEWQELPLADRQRIERGNVEAALGRLKGAFQALLERGTALTTEAALREAPSMATLPELERYRQQQDKSGLPPELRGQ